MVNILYVTVLTDDFLSSLIVISDTFIIRDLFFNNAVFVWRYDVSAPCWTPLQAITTNADQQNVCEFTYFTVFPLFQAVLLGLLNYSEPVHATAISTH